MEDEGWTGLDEYWLPTQPGPERPVCERITWTTQAAIALQRDARRQAIEDAVAELARDPWTGTVQHGPDHNVRETEPIPGVQLVVVVTGLLLIVADLVLDGPAEFLPPVS